LFSINANEVLLPLNLAIPCGLVVNELVTNALKHAFPHKREGNITIELLKQEESVMLAVSDNGIGVPSDFDMNKRTTLGLQLVSLLADQINAQLSIGRANPTRFALTFKLSQH
jgi:two-component sensor histidine kinase